MHQCRSGKQAIDRRHWIGHVQFAPPIGDGGVDGEQALSEPFDERFKPLCQAVCRGTVTAADRLDAATKFTGANSSVVAFRL